MICFPFPNTRHVPGTWRTRKEWQHWQVSVDTDPREELTGKGPVRAESDSSTTRYFALEQRRIA